MMICCYLDSFYYVGSIYYHIGSFMIDFRENRMMISMQTRVIQENHIHKVVRKWSASQGEPASYARFVARRLRRDCSQSTKVSRRFLRYTTRTKSRPPRPLASRRAPGSTTGASDAGRSQHTVYLTIHKEFELKYRFI